MRSRVLRYILIAALVLAACAGLAAGFVSGWRGIPLRSRGLDELESDLNQAPRDGS